MSEVRVRDARPGDGDAIAAIWLANAEQYLERHPDDFRRPELAGFAEELDASLGDENDVRLRLIAERDDEIAGYLFARIDEPVANAARQMVPHLAETRLWIAALGTAPAHQRHGVATALVDAAEEWGRERDATVSLLDTFAESELSVPFWERRMGYGVRSLVLRKRL